MKCYPGHHHDLELVGNSQDLSEIPLENARDVEEVEENENQVPCNHSNEHVFYVF